MNLRKVLDQRSLGQIGLIVIRVDQSVTEQGSFKVRAAEQCNGIENRYVILDLSEAIDHVLEVVLEIHLRVVKILSHAEAENI